MARGRGRTGKVNRFSWREITKTYHALARDLLAEKREHATSILDFRRRFPEESKTLRQQARQHWQREHRSHPEYSLKEPTQDALRAEIDVPEIVAEAPYVQVPRGDQKLGKWRDSEGHLVSAEMLAMDFYRQAGWEPHLCEKALITMLYATFCVSVVQDLTDPRLVTGFRRSTRGWTKGEKNTGLIAIPLPQDFGSSQHFERRASSMLSSSSCCEVDHWRTSSTCGSNQARTSATISG